MAKGEGGVSVRGWGYTVLDVYTHMLQFANDGLKDQNCLTSHIYVNYHVSEQGE